FLSVNPTSASPGQAVTFSGSGFTPNQTVTITLDGQTLTSTANAGGSFSLPYTVPAGTTAGSKTVTARDASGKSGTATLTIATSTPAIPTAPSSSSSGGGKTVALTGSNSLRIGVFALAILL